MSAIHATLRKYATRVMTCREAIQKRFAQGAELPWLVPDVSKLLPEGPVELAVRTIEPPKGDAEAEAIEIDESLEVDLLELPDLLRIARADWNALTWLLWTTGLTEIALDEGPEILLEKRLEQLVPVLRGSRRIVACQLSQRLDMFLQCPLLLRQEVQPA